MQANYKKVFGLFFKGFYEHHYKFLGELENVNRHNVLFAVLCKKAIMRAG